MSRRHLITGGSGYLGVRLATRLLQLGDDVVCFDVRRAPEVPAAAQFVSGDVRDAGMLATAAQGCEVVHHLVGIMPQSRASAAVMRAVNVEGTRNALQAAVEHGVRRFLFASSSEVYGEPQTVPMSEEHPRRPVGEYGRNKVEAEQLCVEYGRTGKIETVRLRPSTLVGAGITERVFRTFLALATAGRPIIYNWPGTNYFQMTAVRDCVDAFVRAVDTPGIAGHAFNIAADGTLTMRDQLRELRKQAGIRSVLIPVPVVVIRPTLRLLDLFALSPLERDHYLLMDRDILLDCTKAKRLLGWQPQQTNIDMILEALEWCRNAAVSGVTAAAH
jgi:dTDP-glucose 4,6-dehydratase